MFYIELRNPGPLLAQHLEHFKGISFNRESANTFENFLNLHLEPCLTGTPNEHLEVIEKFYQCIITSIKTTPLSKHCDFETMWVTRVLKKKDKKTVIDVQFKLAWPESLESFRGEILKKLSSNKQKDIALNAFNNLALPLQELINKEGGSLLGISDIANYKKNTNLFWKQDTLTLLASQIDLSFKRDLVEIYQMCEEQFDYTAFRKKETKGWNAYQLCKSVAPRVCPYCNRNHTPVISSADFDLCRPELDHFIPQSLYPMFAVSFYNLIPSCHSCNHYKHDLDVITKDSSGQLTFRLYHPYIKEDDVSSRPIFTLKSIQDVVGLLINYDSNPSVAIGLEPELDTKILTSLKHFRLSLPVDGELHGFYHNHDKEISDSLRLLYQYPKAVIRQLKKLLNTNPSSGNDHFIDFQIQLLNQIMPTECKNESLGKLKADCLKNVVQHWQAGSPEANINESDRLEKLNLGDTNQAI